MGWLSAEGSRVLSVALFQAEHGGKHIDAKPLKGFHGASVLEIVDDFDGDTYRAVYTVQFKGVLYVLHAFEKKSKKGIATSLSDIRLIKQRVKMAKGHYEKTYEAKKTG
jgi:phage-related protein